MSRSGFAWSPVSYHEELLKSYPNPSCSNLVKFDGRVTLFVAAATSFLLILAVSYLPAVSAQSSSTSTATVSTGTNIPPPTGCTAPGYTAPTSLLATLGSNKTVDKGLTLGNPPRSDRLYEYLTLGGGALLALMILVGIVWGAIALGSRRARREGQEASAQVRRSHTGRNIYLALFVVALIILAAGLSVLWPYVLPKERLETVQNGMVQNIASPYNDIRLNPLSIKYFFEPAYANNQTTLLEGNFTVQSGGEVQVVVIPSTLHAQWFADLQNGTFAGATGCTMGGISVLYDSGPVRSGAFAVVIPPVSSQTDYEVIFANPATNQTAILTANVFWAY